MKKLSIVLVLAIIAAGAVFAGPGADGGKTFVGLAMPETHVERWIKDGATLKSLLESKGYRAEVQYGNADQLQQNQQIQSFLTQGAKALIIGCVNDGVGSVVADAKRSGVKVIAYDRIIQNTNDYEYYLTFNNYGVGTLMGEAIEKALNLAGGGTKYITYFAGSPTDANANFFFQGAADVLRKYIDNGTLKVVGPAPKSYTEASLFQQIATENWSGPLAKTRMEGLLVGAASGVTLDAVLAPNDTLARAIIEALKADKKYQSKLPFVTGQDAEFDSALSIKRGEQGMTVFKDTAKLAEAAVAIADVIAKGGTPNASTVAGSFLITDATPASDLRKAIADVTPGDTTPGPYVKTFLLTPIAVDKNNLNVPVAAKFYTDAQAAQLR